LRESWPNGEENEGEQKNQPGEPLNTLQRQISTRTLRRSKPAAFFVRICFIIYAYARANEIDLPCSHEGAEQKNSSPAGNQG
jgi:hypothetical protein